MKCSIRKRPLPPIQRDPTKPYRDNSFVGLDGQVHKMAVSVPAITRPPQPQPKEKRVRAQSARVKRAEKLHALVKEMDAAGKSIDEICTATGYSIRQVQKIAGEGKPREGGDVGKARSARSEKAAKWHASAREMFKNGASVPMIAEEFGVSKRIIYKITRDLRSEKNEE